MAKWISICCVVALVFCAIAAIAYKIWYPFGLRSCYSGCFVGALVGYSIDHHGDYPNDQSGTVSSLQLLYPKYVGADPEILAGLSGDIKSTRAAVTSGRSLGTNISSWVYFPGLNSADDDRLILLYEREFDVGPGGGRCAGRLTVFADGRIAIVSATDWPQTFAVSEELRRSYLAKPRL